MKETKAQVDAIINSLNFERKQPVSAAQKAAYCKLQKDIADVLKVLNRMHLSLWNGISRHDYHSLPLAAAKEQLNTIAAQIQTISEQIE